MNEEEIKEILKSPNLERTLRKEQKKLLNKIFQESEEMESFQKEMIFAASLKKTDFSDCICHSSSSGSGDHLLNILDYSEKQYQEYYLSLLERYRTLVDRLDSIQRVRLCIETLDDLSKDILVRLYEKNEKWEVVELELEISHRILVGERNQAIECIIKCYHSKLSIREIGRLTYKKERKKQFQTQKTMKGQMSLKFESDEEGGQVER